MGKSTKTTLKQKMILTWVARGADPVKAAQKADRIIARMEAQNEAKV